MGVQGCMVQEMVDQGQIREVSDYCRCDVLDTYFVFLRTMVLHGDLTLDAEHERVAQTKKWLEARAPKCAAYRGYLDQWGDWVDPWVNGGTRDTGGA